MAEPGHTRPELAEHADHFESFEKQTHAARLGMWLFLGSELLLFSAMFAIYAGYRVEYPIAFTAGIDHNLKWVGSVNTLILLISSYLIARSIPAARAHQRRTTAALLFGTLALGVLFLCFKAYEYAQHIHHGILPGGRTPFFAEQAIEGLPMFFNLYYLMTGAHAVHVIVGLGLVLWLAMKVLRARYVGRAAHPIEIGALYWHLVDVVWIFLWPLYYLTGGGGH